MIIPGKLLYTKNHEWIYVNGDVATVGITDYAQSELGDIIFIEFPELGDKLKAEDVIGTIEAVKTVADLFSPINGTIIELNTKLENNPEYINNDPYVDGWILKMKINKNDNSNLLNSKEYKNIIKI